MEEMNDFRWICTLSQHDSLQKQYILVISGDSVKFHLKWYLSRIRPKPRFVQCTGIPVEIQRCIPAIQRLQL